MVPCVRRRARVAMGRRCPFKGTVSMGRTDPWECLWEEGAHGEDMLVPMQGGGTHGEKVPMRKTGP